MKILRLQNEGTPQMKFWVLKINFFSVGLVGKGLKYRSIAPSQFGIGRPFTKFYNFSEIYIFTNKNQKPPGLRVDKNGMLEGPHRNSGNTYEN